MIYMDQRFTNIDRYEMKKRLLLSEGTTHSGGTTLDRVIPKPKVP